MYQEQTFPAFQQTMAPSRGQGGQKYSKCMKMSTPTSLWSHCSYALKWNAGKVYYNARAQLLLHSFNLLFSDVPVPVVVFLNSLIMAKTIPVCQVQSLWLTGCRPFCLLWWS